MRHYTAQEWRQLSILLAGFPGRINFPRSWSETVASATLGRSQDVCKGARFPSRVNGAKSVVGHLLKGLRLIQKRRSRWSSKIKFRLTTWRGIAQRSRNGDSATAKHNALGTATRQGQTARAIPVQLVRFGHRNFDTSER